MKRSENPSATALRLRQYREERETPEARMRRLVSYTCRRHGITLQQYMQLRTMQKDRCKACGDPLQLERLNMVHVDHDGSCCPLENGRTRSCGRCVRGLLCSPCNRAIGLMERYGTRVYRWIQYIRTAERMVFE